MPPDNTTTVSLIINHVACGNESVSAHLTIIKHHNFKRGIKLIHLFPIYCFHKVLLSFLYFLKFTNDIIFHCPKKNIKSNSNKLEMLFYQTYILF